jgi:hypothetical protein
MILRVEGGGVTLVDLDDLQSLSAQIVGDAAIGAWGRREDGHVFVTVQTLLRLAGDRTGDRQWRGEFDGMVDFARGHGWVLGDEVRLHVDLMNHLHPEEPS